MAVKEQLDDVSKSLKGILDQMKGAGEQYKKIESSSKTYTKNVNEAQKALEKVLKTLKDISAEQDKIAKSASRIGGVPGGGGFGSSTGANPATFSTPNLNGGKAAPSVATIAGMPAAAFGTSMIGAVPGALGMPIPQFGGIAGGGAMGAFEAAAAYGVAGSGGVSGGGSAPAASRTGWSRAWSALKAGGKFALGTGAVGIGLAYNATPGFEDAISYRGTMMPTATFGGPGKTNWNADAQMRKNFGNYMSSTNSANMSGAALTMGGFYGSRFNQTQREAGTSFMLTGMDNAAATQGLMTLQSAPMVNRLTGMGIFVNNLKTGDYNGIASVVDQIWNRMTGGRTDITYEDVMTSLRGGQLGATLRSEFGSDPALYQQVEAMILAKAKTIRKGKGARNLSSMKPAQIQKMMGLDQSSSPHLAGAQLSASRAGNVSAWSQSLVPSGNAALGAVSGMNDWMAGQKDNPLAQKFMEGKGWLQGFTGTTEGAAVSNAIGQELALLVGLFGDLAGAVGGLLTVLAASGFTSAASAAKSVIRGKSPSANPASARGAESGSRGGRPGGQHARPRGATPRSVDGPEGRPFAPPRAGANAASTAAKAATTVAGGVVAATVITLGLNALSTWYADNGPEGPIKDWFNQYLQPQSGMEGIRRDTHGIQLPTTYGPMGIGGASYDQIMFGDGRQTDWDRAVKVFREWTRSNGVDNDGNPKNGVGAWTDEQIIAYLKSAGMPGQPPTKLALGGHAGTSTSDSIPAYLSKGEYVVNARAVAAVGKESLDRINSLGHDLGNGYASPAPVASSPVVRLAGGGDGQQIVDYASQFVGQVPYKDSAIIRRNGKQPSPENGWDCSTFTQYVLKKFGLKNAPGVSTAYLSYGQSVPLGQQEPGDILVFDTEGGAPGPAGHVAIYAGNGEIIQAQGTGKGTTRVKLSKWYADRLTSIRRVSGNTLTPPAGWSNGSANSDGKGNTNLLTPASVFYSQFAANSSSAAALSTARSGLPGASGQGVGADMTSMLASLMSMLTGGQSAADIGKQLDASGYMDSAERAYNAGKTGSTSKGGKDLLQRLVAAGFSGQRLREAWAIGMRESGGHSNSYNPNRSTGDNSYGLFQINMIDDLGPQRDAKFKQYVKGYTGYDSLFDADVNIRAMKYMSQRGGNWSSWRSPQYGKAAEYYDQFPSVASAAGIPGYQQGLDRVNGDQNVRVHDGEMILPMTAAEEMRKAIRDMSNRGPSGPINITLKIEKASDEEAVRFAQKVKSLIEDDRRMQKVRSR